MKISAPLKGGGVLFAIPWYIPDVCRASVFVFVHSFEILNKILSDRVLVVKIVSAQVLVVKTLFLDVVMVLCVL